MRMSKHSSCLIHRNLLVGISYSDATPGQSFAYDPPRSIDANHWCCRNANLRLQSLRRTGNRQPWGKRHRLAGLRVLDGLGRQAGYELSADGRRVQQPHLSYEGKGRLSTLTAEGMKNLLLDLPRKRGREQVPLLDQKRRRWTGTGLLQLPTFQSAWRKVKHLLLMESPYWHFYYQWRHPTRYLSTRKFYAICSNN